MPVWGVRELLEVFESVDGQRSTAIPLETKVLTFLSYLRSGNFQWSMGTLSGTSQPSVSRIIEKCANVTLKISKSVIGYPTTDIERGKIKEGFYNYGQIPNVLGVIDGTHVGIRSPTRDEHIYVNRKQFHSINCQVVVDSELKFMDVVAKWPGSTHDSFMWNNSSLKEKIKSGQLGSGWLLGSFFRINKLFLYKCV
jgi:hypothetical protein